MSSFILSTEELSANEITEKSVLSPDSQSNFTIMVGPERTSITVDFFDFELQL